MLPAERIADYEAGAAGEEPLRGASAGGLAAQAAAWLAAHRDELIECGRHNGLARLTARACAERHRRAVTGWVDQLGLGPERRHTLRLSFAVCAACPVGARNAWAELGHRKTATRRGSRRLANGAALGAVV